MTTEITIHNWLFIIGNLGIVVSSLLALSFNHKRYNPKVVNKILDTMIVIVLIFYLILLLSFKFH